MATCRDVHFTNTCRDIILIYLSFCLYYSHIVAAKTNSSAVDEMLALTHVNDLIDKHVNIKEATQLLFDCINNAFKLITLYNSNYNFNGLQTIQLNHGFQERLVQISRNDKLLFTC